ncbi:PepSY domain-containing protein [Alkalicoccus luteus]|uniref:PepSY domain-containing protein n=1 Tax=Alkalicoccus luteus TaxID=1237094 RepID=A0A969PZQ2_9BACI|nr:PepSY domain-containing protein [Alkalicoccus luteus]NJP38507.1 PepSY domain-containing protein [Alkalicoccus luteus]
MTRKTIQLILIPSAAVAALAAVLFLFFQQEEAIEGSAVIETLENRYQAEVSNLYLEADGYHASFETASGEYEAIIDPVTGEVLALEQIRVLEETEETASQDILTEEEIRSITEDTVSGEVDVTAVELEDEDGAPHYSVAFQVDNRSGRLEIDALSGAVDLFTLEEEASLEPLSEEEAVAIALEEHQGEVDDIDLEEENGRLVFEIEIENGEGGVDADIVIDAYTGEVLSVIYDD